MDRLRWGILGTGNIAGQFVDGLKGSNRTALAAVGSRSAESAKAFTEKHGGRAAAGYDAVLADAGVDAVYVSLPNAMHHEWTIKALRAGKHVLCEKPIACTAAQAAEMFDAAESAGRVLAEAFMYRSHPQTAAALKRVRGGELGTLKLIRTAFCFRVRKQEGNVRFDRALSGGALMDVGCYCVNFSRMIAGSEPESVCAVARMHPSGVDEQTSVLMQFPGGLTASFTCGMAVQADNTAYVCGDEGYLSIGWPWKPPAGGAKFSLERAVPPRQDDPDAAPARPPRETVEVNSPQPLYAIEADDFAAAVAGERPPTVSREDSLGNMKVLDEIRRQIGLRWEGEQ